MKIKILKQFQQDYIYYMKDWILELLDFGPFYEWSHLQSGHSKIVVHKSFIDSRIKKGIIKII